MSFIKKQIILECKKINFKYVKINKNIDINFLKKLSKYNPKPLKIPIKNKKDKINFIFIRNSLDFCLWLYPKNFPQGFINLHQKILKMYEAHGFNKINFKEFKKIISPYEDINLAKKRYLIYLNSLNWLNQNFNGDFGFFLKKYNTPDKFLKNLLTLKNYKDFSSRHKIHFYKKAQLLYWELILYKFIKNKNYAKDLTIFPDYLIPAILNHFKILEYSPKLQKIINQKKEIKAGSKMEIELRAASVLIGEYLAKKLKISPPELDLKLWSLAHELEKNTKLNYHKTKTIFY
jgi:hypothetical protein